MKGEMHDVTIIGAGPAGMSAAIYLKRLGLEPLLIERKRLGGLLLNANLVENYPGFPEGISGKRLAGLFEEQLRRWRINSTRACVNRVTRLGNAYRLATDKGDYFARFLVVATGTRPKGIALDGLETVDPDKILYEVADLPAGWRGKRFLVVGGGDAAFDYSLNLASKGGEVSLVFRGRRPGCIPLLLDRAARQRRIHVFSRTTAKSVIEENGEIVLRCLTAGAEKMFRGDFLLIACGREPDVGILPRNLRSAATNRDSRNAKPSLFLVGDARRGLHRQVGISVGDGIDAAMWIADQLREEDRDEDTR